MPGGAARPVLALPLLTADGRPLGWVNLDCDRSPAGGLGGRELRQALGWIVEVIAFVLRDRGARQPAPRAGGRGARMAVGGVPAARVDTAADGGVAAEEGGA